MRRTARRGGSEQRLLCGRWRGRPRENCSTGRKSLGLRRSRQPWPQYQLWGRVWTCARGGILSFRYASPPLCMLLPHRLLATAIPAALESWEERIRWWQAWGKDEWEPREFEGAHTCALCYPLQEKERRGATKNRKENKFYKSKYSENKMKHNCTLLLNSKASRLPKNCEKKIIDRLAPTNKGTANWSLETRFS